MCVHIGAPRPRTRVEPASAGRLITLQGGECRTSCVTVVCQEEVKPVAVSEADQDKQSPDRSRSPWRRVAVVGVVVLLLAGLAAGALAWRSYRHKQALVSNMHEGRELVAAGEYKAGLNKIGPYLNVHEDDAGAAFDYAQAREHVEAPRDRHLGEAVAFYRRVVELDGNGELGQKASARLIDLYGRLGLWEDVLRQTESLRPEDVQAEDQAAIDALLARAAALVETGELRDANRLLPRVIELRPLDVAGQLLALSVDRDLGDLAEAGSRVAALLEEYPDDPRAQLVGAIAALTNGQTEEAKRLALAAAAGTPEMDESAAAEPAFLNRLVSTLDAVGQPEVANDVLSRLAGEQQDPLLPRRLVNRLFRANRWDDVLAQTEGLDPETADGELLGVRGLALAELGRTEEAAAIADALAKRQAETRGLAWAPIVRHWRPMTEIVAGPPPVTQRHDAATRLQSVRASAEMYEHPAFLVAWAEALMDVGEPAAAIDLLVAAAGRSDGGWERPLLELAWTAAADDRPGNAAMALRTARELRPDSPITLAASAMLLAKSNNPTEATELLEGADRDVSEDAARWLTVADYVAGRQSELPDLAPLHTRQLIALLDAAAVANPAHATEVAEALDKGEHDPATAALAAGMAAGANGNVEAAKAAVSSAASDPAMLAAKLLVLRAADVEAARTLAREALAKAGESDLRLLRVILDARVLDASDPDDWAALRRATNTLTEAVGDLGERWSTRLAQLDLNRPDSLPADDALWRESALRLGAVVRRHPRLIDPRMALLGVLEQLDDDSLLLEQLRAAVEALPNEPRFRLALAQFLIEQGGDMDEARRQLAALEQQVNERLDSVAPDERRALAALLGRLGEADRAVALRESLPGAADDLALLELYRQQGRLDAEAMERQASSDDPRRLAFAAMAFEAAGNTERAGEVLDRVDALAADGTLTAETAVALRAAHDARFGRLDEAKARLRERLRVAPSDGGAWESLALLTAGTESASAAAQVAQAGVAAVESGSDSARRLRAFEQATSRVNRAVGSAEAPGNDPQLLQSVPLLGTVISQMLGGETDPSASEAAAKLVELVVDARRDKRPADEVAAEVAPLADAAESLPATQQLAVRIDLATGELQRAADRADRLWQARPRDPEAARLAVDAFTADGREEAAFAAAEAWRELLERNGTSPVNADLTLARLYLRDNQPGLALGQLQPYLNAAAGDAATLEAAQTLAVEAHLAMNLPSAALRVLPAEAAQADSPWFDLYFRAATAAALAGDQAALEAITPADSEAGQSDWSHLLRLAQSWDAVARANPSPEASAVVRRLTTAASTALGQAESPPAGAWEQLGMLLASTGAPREAESAYRTALDLDGDRLIAANNLAMLLIETEEGTPSQERLAEAARLVEHLLSLPDTREHPAYTAFLDTKAGIAAKRGDIEIALATLDDLLQLQPREPEWHLHRAEILTAAGRLAEARRSLAEAERLLTPASLPSLRDRMKRIEQTARLE